MVTVESYIILGSIMMIASVACVVTNHTWWAAVFFAFGFWILVEGHP